MSELLAILGVLLVAVPMLVFFIRADQKREDR